MVTRHLSVGQDNLIVEGPTNANSRLLKKPPLPDRSGLLMIEQCQHDQTCEGF